jgi:hypothetical protein
VTPCSPISPETPASLRLQISGGATFRRTYFGAYNHGGTDQIGPADQGHPFVAKPISIPELLAGIERNLSAHAAS